MLNMKRSILIFFYLFMTFSKSECLYRIIFPDDIILQKLGIATSTTNHPFTVEIDEKIDQAASASTIEEILIEPNRFLVATTGVPSKQVERDNFTQPPTTYRPRMYKNCAWCCDENLINKSETENTTKQNDIETTTEQAYFETTTRISVAFNDLPICSKCCVVQPRDSDDYDAVDTEDEDDRLGQIAIATILG